MAAVPVRPEFHDSSLKKALEESAPAISPSPPGSTDCRMTSRRWRVISRSPPSELR